MLHNTCSRCKFAITETDDAGQHLTCRRYPPTFAVASDGLGHAAWPRVDYDKWCGEFQIGMVTRKAPPAPEA